MLGTVFLACCLLVSTVEGCINELKIQNSRRIPVFASDVLLPSLMAVEVFVFFLLGDNADDDTGHFLLVILLVSPSISLLLLSLLLLVFPVASNVLPRTWSAFQCAAQSARRGWCVSSFCKAAF